MEELVCATARLSTESAQSTPPASGSPKREAIPLPRELRDQIYGYLLLHEHVKVGPPTSQHRGALSNDVHDIARLRSTAHTYHFHPSILGINHAIRKEALEVLTKNNFIIISYDWKELELAARVHGVPIVSQHQGHIARFTQHHLRVHMQHAIKSLRGHSVQALLILAEDMPSFCAFMQFVFLCGGFPRPTLVTTIANNGATKTELPLEARKGDYMRIKFQLRSTRSRPMTPTLQRHLLEPFRCMIIGGQQVKLIDSVETALYAQQLQERMGPSVTCLTPMVWRLFEMVTDVKEAVDDLVRQGDFDRAGVRYSLFLSVTTQSRSLRSPLETKNTDAQLISALTVRLLAEASVTAGFLQLRLGQPDRATEHSDVALALLSTLPPLSMATRDAVIPEAGLNLPFMWGAFWLHNLLLFMGERSALRAVQYGSQLQGLQLTVTDPELTVRLGHDVSAMSDRARLMQTSKSFASDHESGEIFLKTTSACCKPPYVFSSPLPEYGVKPGGLTGFVDEAQLKAYHALSSPSGSV